MKNIGKYIATAVVAIVVIVASAIFIKSNTRRFSQTLQGLSDSLTTQADMATDAPQNTPTQTPSVPVNAPTGAPASETPSDAPTVAAPATTAETLKLLNDAVSALRHAQNFTAVKDQTIDIQLTDCSMPMFTSAINSVINTMGGTKSLTFTFVNGTGTDPEEKKPTTPMEAIPPTNAEFALEEAGIVSLTAAADGANTVYTAKLIAEDSSLTTKPKYHAQTMDILDLASIDLPITVTEANFHYKGATINITLDSTGRVVKYHQNMPLDGTGAGKMGFLSASAEIEGYLDESWTITW